LVFLPATELLSMICLGMIVIFFVTLGARHAEAMVLNMLSARGRMTRPALQRINLGR
jgi:choline-glycine betaine transporter